MPVQQATATLAARDDLSSRARQLLAQQLAECGTRLEPILRATLSDLEQELFRLAEQSSGGHAQQEALEGLREVKRNRADVVPRVLAALEARFVALGRPGPATQPVRGEGDLTLIDPQEFDETIALDDISTRAELHAGHVLFDLCHRYAVLLASPLPDSDDLPVGPHALAQALGEAARDLGLSRAHRLLFYKLCDRRLFVASESFYTDLNEHLKANGILPYLRSYLPRRNVEQEAPPPAPAAQPQDDATTWAPPPAGPPAAQPFPAIGMGTLHELLGARRAALGIGSAAAGSGRTASLDELQEALAALQSRPAPAFRAGADLPHSVQQMQDEMLAELRRATPEGPSPQLSTEHRDVMDLVSLLFDRLLEETRAEGMAQQLLARLQAPLLRVALADGSFFTRRNHPARRLLNTLLETANLWLDRADGSYDAALGQRLQRVVDRVTGEFNGDISLFEQQADDLESHVRTLRRRAEIAERRQVEAAQGRDRLEQARVRANAAISQRLAGRKVAPLTRALLEQAWGDALTLSILRHGEDSEVYRSRLAAADQLLAEPSARDTARLGAELQQGLTQVGLHAPEAEQITRHVLNLPPEPSARGDTPSQTELAIRLKARHREREDAAKQERAVPKAPLNAAEQQALATLKAMPFGTWLDFVINQQGQTVARKLAWFSPVSGHCLLVNARGVAAPERHLEQVARLMAMGQVRLMPKPDDNLLDRVWNAVIAGLRRFGGAAQPETAT